MLQILIHKRENLRISFPQIIYLDTSSTFVYRVKGCKGYKIFDLDTGSTFVSKDVIFYEDKFPLSQVLEDDQFVLPLPAMDVSNELLLPNSGSTPIPGRV